MFGTWRTNNDACLVAPEVEDVDDDEVADLPVFTVIAWGVVLVSWNG